MIYLDNASTTKPKQEVVDVVKNLLDECWQNPSSLYNGSKKAKKLIEDARKKVADFLYVNPNEIVFTSSASESNSMALQGFVNRCQRLHKRPAIITSVIEHKSILLCCDNLKQRGVLVQEVEVDACGKVILDQLDFVLSCIRKYNLADEILVSIQLANNEIGTIQDFDKISKCCRRYKAYIHSDITQAFGHEPVTLDDAEYIDMASASSHKIGALKGTGILFTRYKSIIDPIIFGTQESGMRGGTENVIGIVATGVVLEKHLSCPNKFDIHSSMKCNEIQMYLEESLRKKFKCGINGNPTDDETRLANNISVTLDYNVTGESLVYMLDTSGINISTGSACNSKSNEISHVLKAIGMSEEGALRTIRITISEDTTKEDIDTFIEELDKAIKILESR